jgi:hypothetical protein
LQGFVFSSSSRWATAHRYHISPLRGWSQVSGFQTGVFSAYLTSFYVPDYLAIFVQIKKSTDESIKDPFFGGILHIFGFLQQKAGSYLC